MLGCYDQGNIGRIKQDKTDRVSCERKSQKLTLFEQRVSIINPSCPGKKQTTQTGGDEHHRFNTRYEVTEGDLAHARALTAST